MRQITSRNIRKIAKLYYKPEWEKPPMRITFNNYYRQLKQEYIRGNYGNKV